MWFDRRFDSQNTMVDVEIVQRFPRHEPRIDVHGRCPEAEDDLLRVAAETASRMGLPEPVKPPLVAAEKARRRGFELTAEECAKTILGESWLKRLNMPEPPRSTVRERLNPAAMPMRGAKFRFVAGMRPASG